MTTDPAAPSSAGQAIFREAAIPMHDVRRWAKDQCPVGIQHCRSLIVLRRGAREYGSWEDSSYTGHESCSSTWSATGIPWGFASTSAIEVYEKSNCLVRRNAGVLPSGSECMGRLDPQGLEIILSLVKVRAISGRQSRKKPSAVRSIAAMSDPRDSLGTEICSFRSLREGRSSTSSRAT